MGRHSRCRPFKPNAGSSLATTANASIDFDWICLPTLGNCCWISMTKYVPIIYIYIYIYHIERETDDEMAIIISQVFSLVSRDQTPWQTCSFDHDEPPTNDAKVLVGAEAGGSCGRPDSKTNPGSLGQPPTASKWGNHSPCEVSLKPPRKKDTKERRAHVVRPK